jgi:2-amino-4-hydroxy-6-hydroxymethyldihydropteridine diphosphokinase
VTSETPYPHRAVLSLGANLGRRLANLQAAVDSLADTPGLTIVAVSPVYETAALLQPGAPEQEDYLNAVVVIDTALSADILLMRTQAVEDALGRVRDVRWGPRTMDIDIVLYGDDSSEAPDLTLPHPRAHERAFVLAPWYDLMPDGEFPGHGRIVELLSGLGGASAQGARRRDDLSLQLP